MAGEEKVWRPVEIWASPSRPPSPPTCAGRPGAALSAGRPRVEGPVRAAELTPGECLCPSLLVRHILGPLRVELGRKPPGQGGRSPAGGTRRSAQRGRVARSGGFWGKEGGGRGLSRAPLTLGWGYFGKEGTI